MNKSDKIYILQQINEYAEEALKNIDPQKTKISEQLEKIKPAMEKISKDYQMPLEEVFVLYMDMASETMSVQEKKFRTNLDI